MLLRRIAIGLVSAVVVVHVPVVALSAQARSRPRVPEPRPEWSRKPVVTQS